MASRERRFHRQNQKQRAFGQKSQSETRQFLPAPATQNTRDNPEVLPKGHAAVIENAVHGERGLNIYPRPQTRIFLTDSLASSAEPMGFVKWDGSGSTSAELWAFGLTSAGVPTIYDVGTHLGSFATASATGISAPSASANVFTRPYTYRPFNQSVVAVNGRRGFRWDRANGWQSWSATASADDIHTMWGVNEFKSRIYTWQQDSPTFWYGSVEEVIGTLNEFNLAPVLNDNILTMTSITRDGGSGPDDFAVFIGQTGKVAVYQGSNPGDANDWALVGVYKIGKPVSRDAHVLFGQQTVVLCEDDFYFLPEDLSGKRSSTFGAERRVPDAKVDQHTNAVHWEKEGLLVFSEGSVLNPKQGFAYTSLILTSAPPPGLRIEDNLWDGATIRERPKVEVFNDGLYVCQRPSPEVSNSRNAVWGVGNASQRSRRCRIVTGSLRGNGRLNMALINPVIALTPSVTTTTASSNIDFRLAIVNDQQHRPYTTASANAWITASAPNDTTGLWIPGAGTGDAVQVQLEVLSVSASADVIFRGFNATFSDTGGL